MKAIGRPGLLDYTLLGAISAVVLCYEILLLRVFTHSQWHHFASLAVSLALLGFGAAGTLLSVLGSRLHRNPDRWFLAGLLAGIAGMLLCWGLQLSLTVRPLFAAWDLRELGKLLLVDFSAFIPFMGLAWCIGLAFVRWPASVRPLYGANLLGSGLGSLLAGLLLAFCRLEVILLLLPLGLLLLAGTFLVLRLRRKLWSLVSLLAAGAILVRILLGAPGIPVSDFKRLAYLLDLPDSRILEHSPGLRSELTLIRSGSLRLTTGLSLRWTDPVPSSDVIVLGTDEALPLPGGTLSESQQAHMRARLAWLPGQLRPQGAVLLAGTSEWMTPAWLPGRIVDWLEPDPRIGELFRERTGLPGVDAHSQELREFLPQNGAGYSLILLSGAFPESDAASEDYLLTTEGLKLAIQGLDPDGILAIPVQLEYPPRYAVRLLAMAAAALEQSGHPDPERHVAFIRTLQEGLLLIARNPLRDQDLQAIRTFCSRWEFDLALLPGLSASEANHYHRFPEPVIFAAGQAVFGPTGELPPEAHWFQVEPASDWRPYYWRSMSWTNLPGLLQEFGRQGIIWLDWSLIMTAIKLAVATGLAACLILLPLGRLPQGRADIPRSRILFYFGGLGLGFMLVEMAAFQRCLLYLGDPVITASVVFATFLVGAGLGSLSPPTGNGPAGPRVIFLLILLSGILAFILLAAGQDLLFRIPPWLRIPALILILLPLSWAMGKAFPWGLNRLRNDAEFIPWAWAINGFASVVAAPLATLLSVQWGQPLTWSAGAACYLLAWVVVGSGRNRVI